MEDAAAVVAGDVSEIKRKVDEVLAQQKFIQGRVKELSHQQEQLAAEAKRIQVGVAAMFDRIGATQTGIDELKQDVASLKHNVLSQLQTLTTIVLAIGSDVKVILGYVVSAEVRRVRQLELRNTIMLMEDLVGSLRDRIPLHVVASQLLHTLEGRAITKYSFDDIPDREVFARVTTTLQRHRDALTPAERDELAAYRASTQHRQRAADLLGALAAAERTLIASQTSLSQQTGTFLTRAADLRSNANAYRAAAQFRARRQISWCVWLIIIAISVLGIAMFAGVGRDVGFLAVLPAIGAVIAFFMARASRQYSPEHEAAALEQRAEVLRSQMSAADTAYQQTLGSTRAAAASLARSAEPSGLTPEDLRKSLESTKASHDRSCREFRDRHPEMRFAA